MSKDVINTIITYIAFNVFVYLIGSFITLDFNITNWFLFKEEDGRILTVNLEFGLLLFSFVFYEWFIKDENN